MQELTSRERIQRLLERKPVDRAGFFEYPWIETMKRWRTEGHMGENDHYIDHFKMDYDGTGGINWEANLETGTVVLEENEETRLTRDGNGAVLRRWKNSSGAPEHVDYLVKDRQGWNEHIVPYLKFDRRRINFEEYRKIRIKSAEQNRFFFWLGCNVFEAMVAVCGHEYLLMNMALDPDWIKEMTSTYSELMINSWETLFAEEGLPDGMYMYEDLGFKQKPFMSPAMFGELIVPAYKRAIGWAHQRGLKVAIHSCGFVEPLVPGLIEAGIDLLQAMEVKAGNDVLRLNALYGDKIGFMGNIDIREIASNDKQRIDAELRKKIPPLMKTRTPYIVGSDHSTPPTVDYDTMWYFRNRGLELAKY